MKKQSSGRNLETKDHLLSRKAIEFKSHAEAKGEDSNRSTVTYKVSPLDFVNYLPFLSMELQLPFSIIITRTDIDSLVRTKLQKSKSTITIANQQKHSPKLPLSNLTSVSTNVAEVILTDEHVHIYAKYSSNQLTQVHYYGRKAIPREVFKMIANIVHFYPSLTNITITNGLDYYGIYEISKLLNISRITEVCLGHLNIKNAHYQLLLTQTSNLNNLSLSRCTITNEIVENIMSHLTYPLPASKTLIALNLSCNLITDRGVRFIGKALRSNRCLQYLNLAGNKITDEGASFLFDSLLKFPLTDNEENERIKSYVQYCKLKVPLMTQFFTESNSQTHTNTESKKRISKKPRKDDGSSNTVHIMGDTTGLTEYQKARTFAESILGKYQHPYHKSKIVLENGIHYCLGNNTLCYLNLAYNNLMIHSIRKLLYILDYQRNSGCTPRGLIRVVIEGNPLPTNCAELHDLNYVLETLVNISQKSRIVKKSKSNKPNKFKESF